LKNLPIIVKFLSIMGIFGLFAIGIAFYSTSQMRIINNNYNDLMAGKNRSALYLARSSRNLEAARDGVAELTIATTSDEKEAAKALVDTAKLNFLDAMNKAAGGLPEYAAQINALKGTGLDVLYSQCATAISLGMAASTQAANLAAQQEFANNCASQFPTLTDGMVHETDSIMAEAAQDNKTLTGITDTTIKITYGGIIGGVLLVLLIGFFGVRSWIIAPVKQLEEVMGRLAGGDFDTNVTGVDRKDEIGGMTRAVQVFKDAGLQKLQLEAEAVEFKNNLDKRLKDMEAAFEAAGRDQKLVVDGLAGALAGLAKGNLTVRFDQAVADAYEGLKVDFNSAMETLQETMKSIAANTQGVRSGAGEITQASDDLSRRTEQQAASLEETAAALDEITATVRKTAEGATEARNVVSAAKSDAERSGEVVRETVGAMTGIETSSKQIGNIIGVIDEIAFQTNLLALNAGVEAARAGDAGRGFAVVATEVRALAQRSADAAKEIKTLISASGAQVETGVKLVGETGKALGRIVEQVNRLSTLVTDIAGSAQEQATGLNEVNTAVNQMDQVTQQNAAMVEQSTAASHSLAAEAEALARLIGQFQIGLVEQSRAPVAVRKTTIKDDKKSNNRVHAPVGKFVAVSQRAQPAAAGAEDWDEF
jgi:methyl-accepting chemotaxis protein